LIVGGAEGNVQWFDRRSDATLVLEDTHGDAVTQLKFATQGSAHVAYSGGLDGLVCEIDTSLPADDALTGTCNDGTAVQQLLLCGARENAVAVVSHAESLRCE
jgi:hypothetical protein